ncbi:hypothetical protein MMC22_005871 [Lobaria immixta]|nr:hypothetical protein [Lobaria immixta]
MHVQSLSNLLFIALAAIAVSAAPWYQGGLEVVRSAAVIQPADRSALSFYDRKRHEILGSSGTAPVPVSRSTAVGVSGTVSAPAGTSTANSLNAIRGVCNATFSAVEKRHPRFGGPLNGYYRRALGTGAPFATGTGVPFAACSGGIAPTGVVGSVVPTRVGVAGAATGIASASGTGVAVAGTTASAVPARRRFV